MRVTVDEAAEMLSDGKVVVVPTETVYGLAAIATNPEAVSKIFEIKNRPADNPLICHFYNIAQVEKYVPSIPYTTRILMEQFSPGPISFMLDLDEDSPLKFATCGLSRVIVRIPSHPLFLSIIEKVQQPIAAPSANTSGKVSPTSVAMVEKDLGEKVGGIVDGGNSIIGLESTIIDARNEEGIYVLRPGAIGADEISKVIPESKIINSDPREINIVPGSKYRHYAPATPVFLIKDIEVIAHQRDAAVILMEEDLTTIPRTTLVNFTAQNVQLLTIGSRSDLNEVARNFYRVLSSVDHLNVSKTFFLHPEFGNSSLGKALVNRLERIVSL